MTATEEKTGPEVGIAPSSTEALVDWRRVGGLLGIGWVIAFVVGLVVQGDVLDLDDSTAEIREYFRDDGTRYLAGDYVLLVGLLVFFLPFADILRRVLADHRGWPEMLGRISFYGALLGIASSFAGAFSWGALALGVDNPEVDDSSVRVLMDITAYAGVASMLTMGLFAGAAGIAIWVTGALWRWVGGIAVAGALAVFVGAAWAIDGDDQGALAVIGFVGFTVIVALFVLLASICMLVRRDGP